MTRGGSATDRGPVREVNEDRVLCEDRYGLYAVFDGVGGHNAGEVASQLALETVAGYIARSLPEADDDTWPMGWDPRFSATSNRLRTAIVLANQRVYLAAQSDPTLLGMATTVTAVLVWGNVVSFANVGDSRIYRLEPGPSRLLTEDDAATVDQFDAAGERIGSRRALTRAVGAESEVTPSMAEMPVPAVPAPAAVQRRPARRGGARGHRSGGVCGRAARGRRAVDDPGDRGRHPGQRQRPRRGRGRESVNSDQIGYRVTGHGDREPGTGNRQQGSATGNRQAATGW